MDSWLETEFTVLLMFGRRINAIYLLVRED